jgi:hypothetical protein
MHDRLFKEFLAKSDSPPVRRFWQRVQAIAGYKLESRFRLPFDSFRRWYDRKPQPAFFAALADPAKSKRVPLGRLRQGMLDCEEALAGACYHRDRAAFMEDQLVEATADPELVPILEGGHMMTGGDTTALDEEYQSFVLALRRSLDYLAGACAALFRQEAHRFRSLHAILSRRRSPLADAVLRSIEECERALGDYLEDGEGKSIRSRICHYGIVRVGKPDARKRGLRLIGGPERLLDPKLERVPLRQALDLRVAAVSRCVLGVVFAIIAECRRSA